MLEKAIHRTAQKKTKAAPEQTSRVKMALLIFAYFIKIGSFTFGSGWSILAQMEQEFVDKRRWLTKQELLELVGLKEKANAYPSQLSGGQKQRVAIAGVMAMRPRCIILDEPTAMLDPNGRKEVIRTIRQLNQAEGITVLLITHYMEEAIDADRIIVMDDGKIVMDGKPKEIFSRVRELKTYGLDVPQATELAFELKEAGMPLSDGILSREELVKELLPLL